MQLSRRLDRLEKELLPILEQRKQRLLLQQQQSPENLLPPGFRGVYRPKWIREQLGIWDPRSEAIERYWSKLLVAELKKMGYTPAAIDDIMNGRAVSQGDHHQEQAPVTAEPSLIDRAQNVPAADVEPVSPPPAQSSTIAWPHNQSVVPTGTGAPLTGFAINRQLEKFSRELNRKRSEHHVPNRP